jgi:hypothetical protein
VEGRGDIRPENPIMKGSDLDITIKTGNIELPNNNCVKQEDLMNITDFSFLLWMHKRFARRLLYFYLLNKESSLPSKTKGMLLRSTCFLFFIINKNKKRQALRRGRT